MGFFSWKCAVSGESIANIFSGMPKEQTECYLVTPSRTYYERAYEGYGVFAGHDVFELIGQGNRDKGIDQALSCEDTAPLHVKVVLKKVYDNHSYDELPKSEFCPYQGYFF